MRARLFAIVACAAACTSNKPKTSTVETDTEADAPVADSGETGTATDSGNNGDPGPVTPAEPLKVNCEKEQGTAKVSGFIEGTPARMASAAWYADERGSAWVVLSPLPNACSVIEDFKTNNHNLRALSIWISDFNTGHLAPIEITRETDLEAGDGTPEAVVNGWEPIINLAVMMQHGLMTVRSAQRGETLAVTGLDTWSEYADAVSGEFTACWCPGAADFMWPMVEDSSPPAPPPVSP